MAFHGIDLHNDSLLDARFAIEDGLDRGESKISMTKYYLYGDSFERFKTSLNPEDYVIIEATTNSFWLYDQIKPLVKECYVLNVAKYKTTGNKTDKIDARKLVKKLAYYVIAQGDEDDLPLVYIPTKEVRELRSLFTTYNLNKKTITQYRNRIHSILKGNGIVLKKTEIFKKDFLKSLMALALSKAWIFQLEILFDQIHALEKNTDVIKDAIFKIGNDIFKEEIEILLSIKGFSPLTAIALMSDVVSIERFKNVKNFCAYLRTAPKVKASNLSTYVGNTNRFARSLTCTLMTQSVNHFAEAGNYLHDFYSRTKIGKKAGVYRMALIRKVLVCAYYMLKRKTLFYWTDEKLHQMKIQEFNRVIQKCSNDRRLGLNHDQIEKKVA
jgi:transposase